MEDIIVGRRVPEFEEACNEEAHQDQTQQGTQQVLGGSALSSLPPPPLCPSESLLQGGTTAPAPPLQLTLLL
jgi:hypothetical protein